MLPVIEASVTHLALPAIFSRIIIGPANKASTMVDDTPDSTSCALLISALPARVNVKRFLARSKGFILRSSRSRLGVNVHCSLPLHGIPSLFGWLQLGSFHTF